MDRTIYSVELPKRPGVEKFDTFMGMDVIAQLDGEKHDRLRRLLSQPFSPGAVQALHGAIENHVDDLIDAIMAKGAPAFDFMITFAEQLMPRVLLQTMFGIPRSEWHRFIRMGNAT